MRFATPTNRSIYRTISFLLLLLSFTASYAQTSQWTWMSGDNTANQPGVYGTKNVAAATNKPGNRDSHSGWRDASGNFWIFGGWDISSNHYNDLWKYSPGTGQWTWVSGDNSGNQAGVYGTKGIAAAANKPGGRRNQTAWVDASGNFWIFGGRTNTNAFLNDLWKYNPGTGMWTWMSGDNTTNNVGIYGTLGVAAATNKPGARSNAAGWVDASGNLWLHGGQGHASTAFGNLNDLWKYNISTGLWTWVSGNNTQNISGVYGTKGTAAAANKPGGRYGHTGVRDAAGNVWLFGGTGNDGAGTGGFLSDLWKYNPVTGQWTWMSGNNTVNIIGVYGTKGTGSTANYPGGRLGYNMVLDGANNLRIFAGRGYSSETTQGILNDLWEYNQTNGQWTWQSGENTRGSGAVYGTLGTGSISNKPSARYNAASWIDGAGNIWVFGGFDHVANNYNDLWKFNTNIVLPLRQISLLGNHRNSDNVLSWETTGEENTHHFVIERSNDGTEYSAIATVAAAGSGNNHYSYTDHGAADNSWYYRIQVVDKDGRTSYSAFVRLAITAEDKKIAVYPNPATSGIRLQVNDNSLINTTARLYNTSGQLLAQIAINSREQYINLQHFPKGTLTLRLNNGQAITIIKE